MEYTYSEKIYHGTSVTVVPLTALSGGRVILVQDALLGEYVIREEVAA